MSQAASLRRRAGAIHHPASGSSIRPLARPYREVAPILARAFRAALAMDATGCRHSDTRGET